MDNAKILESWDTEQYRDWYAVDKLGADGAMRRLFVGDCKRASKIAADYAAGAGLVDFEGNPCEPGEFGPAAFYRCTLISPQAAYDYMRGIADDVDGGDELLTVHDAAAFMGITRQSVHSLIKRGRLAAEFWGGGYRILRASCALFEPIKPGKRKA